MKSREYRVIPQNYKKNVEWIIGAYNDAGASFPNGFQKDAIQNAAGARANNHWKNWRCDIYLIKNHKGEFLVIEDSGTVGLIGRNISMDEINELMQEDISLDGNERLARFSSMFNSGDNKVGAGLYGAGKSVYSVASKDYCYYYDSLRSDGKYVANWNNCGNVMNYAYEEDAAKEFIFRETGFEDKKTVGTRIIIKSPKDEIVESINSGEMQDFILESWWLVINRLESNSAITVNGTPVTVPKGLRDCDYKYDLPSAEIYVDGYKVKHFGLYVYKDGGNDWNGISYYRRGMKIGQIKIEDVPDKIKGKFWGYVEVDKDWEEELSKIEDNVHFGVSKGKWNKDEYQKLKRYCNQKARECFVKWKFIRDKEAENEKINNQLKEVAAELQDLFSYLKIQSLDKVSTKADIALRCQNVQFPVAGTERVTTGDEIKFDFQIRSTYAAKKKVKYNIYTENPVENTALYQIASGEAEIDSNGKFVDSYTIPVNQKTSVELEKNKIILDAKVVGGRREHRREIVYYYDIEPPKKGRECVELKLHTCDWPHKGTRRVNFGDSLKNVSYSINNKRNYALKYRLNISIHDSKSKQKIVDIASLTGVVKPFEDVVTDMIGVINFDSATYSQYMDKGVVELRARLVANDDDDEYEKGDKITHYNCDIFINRDEDRDVHQDFDPKSVDEPDDMRRSWHVVGSERNVYLNIGHRAYNKLSKYPDVQKDYLREQMMKQYVLLYLAEGKYELFDPKLADMDPQEAVNKVMAKLDYIYNESLKRGE